MNAKNLFPFFVFVSFAAIATILLRGMWVGRKATRFPRGMYLGAMVMLAVVLIISAAVALVLSFTR